jgi:Spy/CpxP family protein refolding chaperone
MLLVSLCLVSTAALADHRDGPRGKAGQFFKELDLSQQQREQLRGLRTQRERMHELGMEMRKQRRELGEMLRSESKSDAEVMKGVDALNRTLSDLNVARVKNMLEMKRILTPQQREKAREMLKKKWQERRDSDGKGGPDWLRKRMGEGDSCSGNFDLLTDDPPAR